MKLGRSGHRMRTATLRRVPRSSPRSSRSRSSSFVGAAFHAAPRGAATATIFRCGLWAFAVDVSARPSLGSCGTNVPRTPESADPESLLTIRRQRQRGGAVEQARRRRRVLSRRGLSVWLAALLTAPLVVAGAAGPVGASGVALFPNLKTLPPRDLRLDRADITPDLSGNFHNVLRFSNDTYNAGQGPLIVNAQIDPSTKSGPSTQRVMNSDAHVHRHTAEQQRLLARSASPLPLRPLGRLPAVDAGGVQRVDRERPYRRRAQLHRTEDDELRHRRGIHRDAAGDSLSGPVRHERLRRGREQRDPHGALGGLGRHLRLVPPGTMGRPQPGHARQRHVRAAFGRGSQQHRLRERGQGRHLT